MTVLDRDALRAATPDELFAMVQAMGIWEDCPQDVMYNGDGALAELRDRAARLCILESDPKPGKP